MTIAEKQRQLTGRLRIIEDPQERLSALISRAKKWPAPDPADITDAHRVPGCQSRVWVTGELSGGVCRFRMECESPMVKGLVALVCEIHDGATPADILASDPAILDELGLTRMISPTRLAGLAAVRERIRTFASHALAQH